MIDLTALTIALFGDERGGGHVELFRDEAVIGGVPQDMGGASRALCETAPCNIQFRFDLDAVTAQDAGGSGVTYRTLGNCLSNLNVTAIVDGVSGLSRSVVAVNVVRSPS